MSRQSCAACLSQFANGQRITARQQKLFMMLVFVQRGEPVILANFKVDVARLWRKDMKSDHVRLLHFEPVNRLAVDRPAWIIEAQCKARVTEVLPILHHRQYNGNQPNGIPPG